MDNFNKLNPGQTEVLAVLSEECAEVIQAVSKILRHGLESRNPDIVESEDNREAMTREIGDIMCIVKIMIEQGFLSEESINEYSQKKRVKIQKYFHHQGRFE